MVGIANYTRAKLRTKQEVFHMRPLSVSRAMAGLAAERMRISLYNNRRSATAGVSVKLDAITPCLIIIELEQGVISLESCNSKVSPATDNVYWGISTK